MLQKHGKLTESRKAAGELDSSFEGIEDGALTTRMNEPTVTYSSGTVDHLCLVWFMPGTSLPVEMDACVCCPSSQDQMSVK